MDRTVLAGSVEGEDIVAALDFRPCPFPVELLSRAVEARVHDEERPLDTGFVYAIEVAGERCVS